MPRRDDGDTAVAGRGVLSRGDQRVAATWACLVVSEDEQRRQGFVDAAELAGWVAIPCESVGGAVKQSRRWRSQLTVVDLGQMAARQKSAYLQFAGTATSRETLLLIGDEPTVEMADAELLSRQAGAWVYLPSPDFDDALTGLFADARKIAEKIAGGSAPVTSKTG